MEDNPGDAELIREGAREEEADRPIEFEVCESLAEALVALAARLPDLVLLDLGLPDSSGTETFERLQAAAPDTPTIVLTGMQDPRAGDRCIALGAHDHLVKGRVERFIAHAVYNAVGRFRAMKAVAESRAPDLPLRLRDRVVGVDGVVEG